MSLALTVVAVAAAALLLLLAERTLPLRAQRCLWLRELAVNLALSALAFGVAAVLVRPAVFRAMGWSQRHDLGLVYLVEMPAWARGLFAFVLLDLTFYYWHRLNHEWPALWRFHNVHHCDPDLGVSTSFRFHFAEVALSTVFRVVQVSWWDRLHRTLRLNVPQSRIVIGVPGYSAPEDNQIWTLLSMPFREQRDYWTHPGGGQVQREPEELGSNLFRLEE